MPSKESANHAAPKISYEQSRQNLAPNTDFGSQDTVSEVARRIQNNPSLLSPSDVYQLQRTMGNQVVSRLLLAKQRSSQSLKPQIANKHVSTSIIQLTPEEDIRRELHYRFSSDDHTEIATRRERLRQAFQSVRPVDSQRLYDRLTNQSRDRDDLAILFQQSIAGTVRAELLEILQSKFRESGNGEQGNPNINTPEGALIILQNAGRILHPSNVIGQVNHMNVGRTPEALHYMLYVFWLARSALDNVNGRHVSIGGRRRRELLHTGLQYARPLIDRVEQAGLRAELHIQFWSHYYDLESDTFFQEAEAQVEQGEHRTNGAQPLIVTPERQTEEVLMAVFNAHQALDNLRVIVSTTARFTGSQADLVAADIIEKVNTDKSLENVKTMPLLQGILYARGILNTIEAIYQFSNLEDRQHEAQRHPNLFATITDLLQQVTRLLEGIFALSCGFAAVVARLLGYTDQAASALALGTRTLRVLGTIGAGFQFLYGFSVLLQPNTSSEQRRNALFNVGMGGAGLASIVSQFSAFTFLQGMGGPLTVAVLVTAAEISWLRSEIAGFDRGFMTFGLNGAYQVLQDRANLLGPAANKLAVALQQQRQAATPNDPAHPESSLKHGLSMVVREANEEVRERLERTLDRMIHREPGYPIIQEPSGYPALHRRFEPLHAQLSAARGPEQTLQVARNTLEVIRLAFREYNKVYIEELRSMHRDSTFLGGMHGGE